MMTVPFKFMDKLLLVLKISRPITWAICFLLLGNGMLYSRTITGTLCLRYVVTQTFTFSIPFAIIFNGVNDVYDYETDRRNPRKVAGGLEGSVLQPGDRKNLLIAAYFSTVVMLLSSLSTQCRDNILATILLLIIIWQYSCLPLRIKEIPVLDSLSNGCIVFLIWFFGFSFSGSSISEVPLRAYMTGFCMVAGHVLAAVVDSDADAAAGQGTIATAMGKRPALIFAALSYAIGSLTIDPVGSRNWLFSAIMVLPCFKVAWAHRTLQAVVLLIFLSHLFWFFLRLLSLEGGAGADCIAELMFDVQFMPLPLVCGILSQY